MVLVVGFLVAGGVAAAGPAGFADAGSTPDSGVAGLSDPAADGASDAGIGSQSAFTVDIVNTTAPVEGDPLTVTVEVENTGEAGEQVVVADAGPLGTANTSVSLPAGESEVVELSIDTNNGGGQTAGDAANSPYTLTVTSGTNVDAAAVEVGLPAVGNADGPPQDLTGNSAYEDADGDGSFDIFDVQSFFNSFVDPEVQNHVWAFDYNNDGDATIFDVQELFNLLSADLDEQMPFEVTLTGVDTNVPAGEQVSVAYQVENAGDSQDTQSIALTVDGTDVESQELTLGAGETFDGTFVYGTQAEDTPGIGVGVSSETSLATEPVTVSDSAAFAVNITNVDEAVVAGETVTVSYAVQNTGEVADTQNITFAVDGAVEDTESDVTLDGGQTFNGTFTYATVDGDVPAVDVSVSSANDSVGETVTVNAAALFDVAITGLGDPVTAGETVTVSYEVENTGDVADTQSISFAVDGTVEDTEAGVQLDGGETSAGTFSYETETGDVPNVTVTIASEDDAESATATVLGPAFFAVSITGFDDEVVQGETATVSYEVENTGAVADTQDITFTVDGELVDTETSVQLDGGQTFDGTFGYETGASDVPEVAATVASQDNTATEAVAVLEPAVFEVTLDAGGNVSAGAELGANYTVENTGDATDTQNITFAVDGTVEDTETAVTLDGGATVAGQFSYQTGFGDAPNVTVTVASEDDTANQTVPVIQEDVFAVSITAIDQSVLEGETVTVSYEVDNTGEQQDTQDIEFAVNGTVEDTETDLTLNGSESFEGTFSYQTGAADVPEIAVKVASNDTTADRTVAVNEPAFFEVVVTGVDDPVTAGEQLTVDYTVENTGGVEATQDITLTVNGSTEATETNLTLGGGVTFEGAFVYETGSADVPEISIGVASEDDSASATATVLTPASFAVDIVDTTTPVEGADLTVTAVVENAGDVEDTQTIDLAVGALGSNATTVTLGGGATTEVTLAVGTGAGEAGEYTATVTSDDDTATANVTVLEPAAFEVSITSIDAAVTEGQTVTAEYTVENTGDVADTQNITLTVNGTVEDTETGVTLNSGAALDSQFTYGTVAGDSPAVAVTVASEDDAAGETVTVNAPASFDVAITDADGTVVEGGTVTVDYAVENTGDLLAAQDVDFAVNGTVEDTQPGVELDGGESVTGQFSYDTVAGDSPAVTVTVASEDDTASETVAVVEPAFFTVSITNVNDPVTEGESVTVDYAVENTGGTKATQDIDFEVGGTVEDTETDVTLAGGATFTGQFSYATVAGDAPSIDVAVASGNESAGATVAVEEPALFAVTITDSDSVVTEGDPVTVNYTVENTGDATDTQDIEFAVEGAVEDTETGVQLDGGATVAGQFSYDTVTGDAPGIDISVASEDDTANASVTVEEPALFDVVITNINNSVAEGETITVDYTVTNTGDVTGIQDINVTVNGTVESTSEVTLAGNSTVQRTFEYGTGIGDSPAVTVAVASEDSEDSATVTVSGTNPDIVASLSTEEGTIGETVGVEFDVVSFSGQGDSFGSYQFEVSYDESVLSFQSVTSGGWGNPFDVNDEGGVVAVADFAVSGQTPVEPALTFEFEIVGSGSSPLEFTEEVNANQINDGQGDPYQTKFEPGAAGTDVNSTVTGTSGLSTT